MNTFNQFAELVRDSVDGQAKRKNYTENGAEGENKLMVIIQAMGIAEPHGIGEIVYKCVEYLKNPREVLLIKIAGWAYIIWKGAYGKCYTADDRSTGQGEIYGTETVSKRQLDVERQEGTRSVDRQMEGGFTDTEKFTDILLDKKHFIWCRSYDNRPCDCKSASQCGSGDATGTPY